MTTAPSLLLVFVNERPVRLPAGADAAAAVAAFDPTLGGRLAAGEAYLTDGRGLPLAADQVLGPGDIIRVVVSARRPEAHADA